MGAIKNVGKAADSIIEARSKRGSSPRSMISQKRLMAAGEQEVPRIIVSPERSTACTETCAAFEAIDLALDSGGGFRRTA
jgi:hypothetical protein